MEKRPHRQDRRVGDSTPTPAAEQPAPAIDPTLYAREDLRRILAALDIGGLYRTLKDEAGVAARQLWRPTRYDPYGDLDRPTASLALRRGRFDLAESLAATSVLRWEGGRQISRAQSGVLLATIHVKAGESRGSRLAHDAITAVTKLSSVRARRRLEPLVAALESRTRQRPPPTRSNGPPSRRDKGLTSRPATPSNGRTTHWLPGVGAAGPDCARQPLAGHQQREPAVDAASVMWGSLRGSVNLVWRASDEF